MQRPPDSDPAVVAEPAAANAIFRQAAAQARDALNAAELGALLGTLGFRFDAAVPPPAGIADVDLRIAIENTREFGMVISAGSGGLDAALGD